MNVISKIKLIERADGLIRRKATGSPDDLSDRLGISTRNIFNLINLMKEMGAPIYFCKNRNSYCYEEEVTFCFGFTTSQNSTQEEKPQLTETLKS